LGAPKEQLVKTTIRLILSICCASALTALAACNHDSPPAQTAHEPAPGPQGANAREAIAQARCAREARCDNIGGDRKFTSTDDCTARIREEWRDDLSARECPAGWNESELNECLREVRFEECSSPFDTLSRMAACTSAQICTG
jgi:hypothetical protein